jgi:tRNA(Ile)-lysidine synthase
MEKLFVLAKEYDMLPAGERILCGVSGGADSMCLLAVLHEAGIDVVAAHYNHRLRGADSDGDEAFVGRFCLENGIPLVLGSGDVAAEAAQRKQGLEETARELRYAFLQEAAEQQHAVRITTAHHADDNAETFLMNFIRGTGLQGLCGIPPRRGNIVRPLLTTKRAEIMDYVTARGIPFRHDASNDCLDFTRNQLRHQVMPLLQEMNPKFLEHATNGIRRLRADNDFLNARAAVISQAQLTETEEGIFIARRALVGQPPALGARVIRQVLGQLGSGGVAAQHITAILALASRSDGSAQISLPDGITVLRSYERLLFHRNAERAEFQSVEITEGITEVAGTPWLIFCKKTICPAEKKKKDETFFLKYGMLKGMIVARPRRTGDTIRLPKRGSKTVKKLFTDAKLPRWTRDRWPVLADELGVIAVAGFGPEESRLAAPGEDALEILLYRQGDETDASGY